MLSRAATHRRHGLKVPEQSFNGCRLQGWLVSPYTAKVRSMLAYKQIPFEDISPSAPRLYLHIAPNVGRIIMPTVQLADGSWRQDSALICDEIEAEHPEPTTKPAGAAQQLAALLLELYADEWLPMLALHYRWNLPANSHWAEREFGRCAFPWLPSGIAARLVAPFASKMRSFLRVQGVSAETRDGVERSATHLLDSLETHFCSGRHRFLLGGRPCRGDFALYGPLYAHLCRDPGSRALFNAAPSVVGWLERLHGHTTDPAFPDMACRARREGSHEQGDSRERSEEAVHVTGFAPADEVPETLDPIFRALFQDAWPFLESLSDSIDGYLDRQAAGAVQGPLAVPRAFDYSSFTVGGMIGERRQLTYSAWRLHRPLDLYRSLALAPSRSLEHASAEAWLHRLGSLEAFRRVQPRWRLERQHQLPLKQETFKATRVLGI